MLYDDGLKILPCLQVKNAQKSGRVAADVTTTSRPPAAQQAQDPARQPGIPVASIQVDFGPPKQAKDILHAPVQQPPQQEASGFQPKDQPNSYPGSSQPASQQERSSGNALQDAGAQHSVLQRFSRGSQGVGPQGDEHMAVQSSVISAQQQSVAPVDRGLSEDPSLSRVSGSKGQGSQSFASPEARPADPEHPQGMQL